MFAVSSSAPPWVAEREKDWAELTRPSALVISRVHYQEQKLFPVCHAEPTQPNNTEASPRSELLTHFLKFKVQTLTFNSCTRLLGHMTWCNISSTNRAELWGGSPETLQLNTSSVILSAGQPSLPVSSLFYTKPANISLNMENMIQTADISTE